MIQRLCLNPVLGTKKAEFYTKDEDGRLISLFLPSFRVDGKNAQRKMAAGIGSAEAVRKNGRFSRVYRVPFYSPFKSPAFSVPGWETALDI